ncbi:MAG: DUF4384 domain-containing protein [Xanthobacteraceae bacterium]
MMSATLRWAATIVFVLAAGCVAAEAGHPTAGLNSAASKPAVSSPTTLMAQAATPAVAMPNPAKLAIKMMPGSPVELGTNVEFQITSAKRGYVLLVDIDSTGKMTQIFPNPELLERMDDDNINLIRANGRLTVPNETITKQGFSYRATGPVGATAIVAILSHQKVQLIDLPDMAESGTTAASANRLLKWVNELRIADPHSGKLLPSEWSYDFKSYDIR